MAQKAANWAELQPKLELKPKPKTFGMWMFTPDIFLFLYIVYVYLYIYLSEFQRVDICTLSASQMCNPCHAPPSHQSNMQPSMYCLHSNKKRGAENTVLSASLVCVCLSARLSVCLLACPASGVVCHDICPLVCLSGSGAHPCLA